jgi:predicted nucleic-acid-binding protein
MQIVDANIILRYLLKDDKTQFNQAKLILDKNAYKAIEHYEIFTFDKKLLSVLKNL